MTKDCQHLTLSVMRSGPDVSAYCTKCWKLVFKSKEAIVWKYSLASTFRSGCVCLLHKVLEAGLQVKGGYSLEVFSGQHVQIGMCLPTAQSAGSWSSSQRRL